MNAWSPLTKKVPILDYVHNHLTLHGSECFAYINPLNISHFFLPSLLLPSHGAYLRQPLQLVSMHVFRLNIFTFFLHYPTAPRVLFSLFCHVAGWSSWIYSGDLAWSYCYASFKLWLTLSKSFALKNFLFLQFRLRIVLIGAYVWNEIVDYQSESILTVSQQFPYDRDLGSWQTYQNSQEWQYHC